MVGIVNQPACIITLYKQCIKQTEKPNMTTTELMNTALVTHATKDAATKDMHETAADAVENIKSELISKQTILRIKDYLYYRGRGWASETDPITRAGKDEEGESEKFPDRVSPCFRRLVTIVDDLRKADMLDILDVYLNSLKEYGITISIDTEKPCLSAEKRKSLKTVIDTLSQFQQIICNTADELKDELGVVAEDIKFSPRNKFKEIVSFAFRKNNGKDVDDKIHDRIFAAELYENGLTSVKTGEMSPS